ncbi:tetracycline resistance protein, class H-like isoform X1 [Asterias rubens]|uniref:tetracycline resistance protein, class H-like isoform X1 n=1 Tax=Asterias rubens TaxID=7604 RepID=UPI0014551864|nr:tetracycline resistance protein, class H-like isoform X1 [Asterias rubens]
MIIFLEMGSLKSFGVLFIPMMDSLECSAAELGTVIGMSNSIGVIIAPITGNLAKRYGSRVCVMTGGTLLFVGYLASAFTWNIFQLTITLGITTGNCLYGLGEISGSIAAGLFYDLTRSYDLAFVGLGIVNVVMMVLMLMDGVISDVVSTIDYQLLIMLSAFTKVCFESF